MHTFLPILMLLLRCRMLLHRNSDNVLMLFIRELEIILDIDVLLDLEEDDGRGNQEATHQKAPAGCKLCHEGCLLGVHAPHACCSCGLESFVESGKVGEFSSVVGERAHEPRKLIICQKKGI